MSGVPTEAEIQTQWKAAVSVLETMRAHVDTTHAAASGLWDVLEQSLEGTYTPTEMASFVNAFRAGCSSLVSPQMAQRAIRPIINEYAAAIDAAAVGGDVTKGLAPGTGPSASYSVRSTTGSRRRATRSKVGLSPTTRRYHSVVLTLAMARSVA
jgi:hypothetical protein